MRVHSLSLFCILIYSVTCAQVETLSVDKIETIDQVFERWDKPNSPGVAIGIISNNEIIYSKGYGMANLEHKIPNSPQTAFSIASNSKQFTAASIILLAQRGKLDLNQSLSSFFPEFYDYAKTITIKNLLNHTSGIRDYAQITYLSGLRPDDYYNDDDILKWIKNQKGLNFPPGEEYLYCNAGYWLLGQIVEKVSGMNLADFSKKEIFEPLGMTNTHFLNNNTMIIEQRASGYSPSRSGGFRNISSMLEQTGNTGVYTTVEDIEKWDNEFYEGKVLKANFWKLMTTKGILNNGKEIEYASGLILADYNGLSMISHGGRVPGFNSDIIRFPDEKLSIIVLSNTADADARRLGRQIVDILLKDKFLKKEVAEKIEEKGFIKLSNKQLKNFEGSYWNSADSYSRKIAFKNDTLYYERSSRNKNTLLAISENEFKMINTPPGLNVSTRFSKNNIMTFIENGNEVASFKKYTPAVYSEKEMQNFTGIYYSEEIDTKYELKLHKNNLQLFINGRRSVPLQAIMTNLFNSPMALFQFKENNAIPNEFSVSTPRVKNIVFKRVK